MGKKRLPESLRRFVERQTTVPVTDLWKGDPKEQRSPYGSYWYRAVACILLSGRVQAKADGDSQHDRREPPRQGGQLQAEALATQGSRVGEDIGGSDWSGGAQPSTASAGLAPLLVVDATRTRSHREPQPSGQDGSGDGLSELRAVRRAASRAGLLWALLIFGEWASHHV